VTHPTRNIGQVVSQRPVELRVKPQDAYLSFQCPQAVQLDILSPVAPIPRSDFFGKLSDEGSTYEKEVFELLISEVPDTEFIPPHIDQELREELTLECLNAGVPLILGGRLPTDSDGRRVGEPDVLVRVSDHPGPSGRWAYRPVDIKNHLVRARTGDPADDLAEVLLLDPADATENPEEPAARCNPRDVFQLAHYQRMLEACGNAASNGRWAGVIGKEQRLVWYDLDAPWGDQIDLDDGQIEWLSIIESYDLQFLSRLAVIDQASAHKEDPGVALLAEPVLISDCPTCGWREFCMEKLEEAGDLSLLSGISQKKRLAHHEKGVTDLHGLARLDYQTARLMKDNVDLLGLRVLAADADLSTPIAEIIPRRKKQISDLARQGFRTVRDLARLHDGTLSYAELGMRDLVDQIDRARARVSPNPAYRMRGVETLDVPRADMEIDVDMESTNDGVYLWGVLVSERDGDDRLNTEYKPFVSWDQHMEVAQLQAFKEFWDWLCGQRDECARTSRTLRAYCFSKGAENGQMKRIAPALGLEDEVKEFLESDQWVDLHEVIRRQLVTGHSMGLKDVAPLAGFQWRCDDSGGTQAIVRYDEASATYDSLVRQDARRWLLEYNEDDVRATAALRAWLDGEARQLLSVGDLGF
jgi:predicted RecB family nuclease